MKTICVVTSTRADYGLLYWPIRSLLEFKDIKVNIVATGTHLSSRHGHTVDVIKVDKLKLDAEIDIGINGDRPSDVLKVMTNAINNFSVYFEKNRPDLLLILGDRYEIFSIAQVALVHNIPIAHIHGGEVTEGALDESFRHSITKMASLHFTSTDEYRKRVIQLGESPNSVFAYGAPGLDNVINLNLLSKESLEKELNFKFGKRNILITYHPVTIDEDVSRAEALAFFSALHELDDDICFFISRPNADTFSSIMENEVSQLAKHFGDRVCLFSSLGQLKYLSLMKQVDLVAGNSSSGIIEAPFLAKPVLNVGIRQLGRASSEHVIHVNGGRDEILEAFRKGLSEDFKNKVQHQSFLYGHGDSSEKIAAKVVELISTLKVQKKFHDL